MSRLFGGTARPQRVISGLSGRSVPLPGRILLLLAQSLHGIHRAADQAGRRRALVTDLDHAIAVSYFPVERRADEETSRGRAAVSSRTLGRCISRKRGRRVGMLDL